MPDDLDFLSEAATASLSVTSIIFYILWVVAVWKIFTKAGYSGFLAIIPIVNVFFLVKITGYSAWMTLLLFIPIVNFIFGIFLAIRLGDRFGKSAVWSLFLLWLFQIIGFFILGYGSATYTKKN